MYLRTFHKTYLAVVEGGVLGHMALDDEALPLLVTVSEDCGLILDGPLSGCTLSHHGNGVTLHDGTYYLCAAQDVRYVRPDRTEVGAWEIFELVPEDDINPAAGEVEIEYNAATLIRCDRWWGRLKFIKENPSISTHSNCVYMPYKEGLPWGLFNTDGSAIIDSFTNFTLYNQSLLSDTPVDDISEFHMEEDLVYIGHVNCHFGHFIVDTLPRLWMLNKYMGRRVKMLCQSDISPKAWFSFPHVAAIFSQLGLQASDFILFDKPTRLNYIETPRSSLIPQRSIHKAYAKFAREMFADLIGNLTDECERPVYYSKTRLPFFVGRIRNEMEIERYLQKIGVDIVYPETLSFVEQIKTMAGRSRIIGTTGSFLHASIFCPPRNITALNPTRQVNANFGLLDMAGEHKACYLYDPKTQLLPAVAGTSGNEWQIPTPRRVAEQLYEAAMVR